MGRLPFNIHLRASTAGEGGWSSYLPAHPRIWMNGNRIAKLQLQKANNTTIWQNTQSITNSSVAAGTGYNGGDEEQLWDLGLAYLAGGTNTYTPAQIATRASFLLNRYCNTDGALHLGTSSSGLKYDSAYPYRFIGTIIAGFDWCYDALTADIRHIVATWLMDAADYVWPETNSARVGGWGVNDPGNNYFAGFMFTGVCGLAAYGDDVGTTTYSPGSGTNRPDYHITLAASKWTDTAKPYYETGAPILDVAYGALTKGGSKGGLPLEGTGYGWAASAWFISEVFDAYNICTLPLNSTTWFTEIVTGMMHFTTPGFAGFVPFGDGGIALFDRRGSFRESFLAAKDSASADSTLNSQAQKWLNSIAQISGGEFQQGQVAKELIRYDPSISPVADLSSLGKDHFYEGVGMYVYRDDWADPNSLLFVVDSGDIGDGHRNKAANSLMIWAGGDWITCSANIYGFSGIDQDTKYYNCITAGLDWAGRLGQNIGPGWNSGNGDPNGGYFKENPSVASNLVYTRTQAKNAYGNANVPFHPNRDRQLDNFLRTVVYLPTKKSFFVVDQVTLASAYTTNEVVAYWHSKTIASLGGSNFTMTAPTGGYHAYGTVLLPSPGVTIATDSEPLGNAGAITSYVTTVTVTPGEATYLFVTALQVSNAGSAPYTPTASSDGTNLTCTIDGLTVTVPLNGTSAVTVA